jgi:hypothetical protein
MFLFEIKFVSKTSIFDFWNESRKMKAFDLKNRWFDITNPSPAHHNSVQAVGLSTKQDPHVFGPPGSDPLVRGAGPDPDPTPDPSLFS